MNNIMSQTMNSICCRPKPTKEQLEEFREKGHNLMIKEMVWKDNVMFVGALLGVCAIGLICIFTGVIQ